VRNACSTTVSRHLSHVVFEVVCRYNTGQAVTMLMLTAPTFIATIALLVHTLMRGGWPSRLDLVLLLISFSSAWVLWLPASIMGFAHAAFPRGYMIAGAILGHAQALVNPYLYGVRWRDSVLRLLEQQKSPTKPEV